MKCAKTRENEGTERDIEGVGWDMTIPKLFLVLGGNGRLFHPVDLRILKVRSTWK